MLPDHVLVVILLAGVRSSFTATITSGLHIKIHDGSAGEYGGNFLTYPYTRKVSCGLQCSQTSGCWMWSHSSSTSICHVYTSITSPMALSNTPSSFSSYGLATSVIEGYYVPGTRTNKMQNALNLCNNMGMTVAYEPDVSVMQALHEKLGSNTIFIGVKRQTSAGSVWVDGFGNVVDTASVNWESGQPNNGNGNEDYTLSFKSQVADISSTTDLGKTVPVICFIPTS